MQFRQAILAFFLVLITMSVQAQNAVLVSSKPMALLYHALVGENSAVEILLPEKQNTHDYALTVTDLKKLHNAEYFFYFGGANEAFLSKITPRFANNTWFALSQKSNEHIWLDPSQYPTLVEQLAQVLSTLYPAQAEQITINKHALLTDIAQWQTHWQTQFTSLKNTPFLLGHSAFLPFAHSLGLDGAVLYFASHGHGHTQSGAKTLMLIQRAIAEKTLYCAIEEPDISFAQLRKRYPHLQTVLIDPLADNSATFMAFLQQSTERLYQCLQHQGD